MRTEVAGICPVCGEEMTFLYQTEDIPYFPSLLIISAICGSCGFRFSDTMLLGEREPVRWELPVREPADLDSRVVRSMQAAIIVPELGIRIDPGPACEGFVSNVEGVLSRIEKVLDGILNSGEDEDEEARSRTLELKDQILMIKEGRATMTLIIEDPSGNSLILSGEAHRSPLECGEDTSHTG